MPVSRTGKDACVTDRQGRLCHHESDPKPPWPQAAGTTSRLTDHHWWHRRQRLQGPVAKDFLGDHGMRRFQS